jgi:hypothetical protein
MAFCKSVQACAGLCKSDKANEFLWGSGDTGEITDSDAHTRK